MVIPIAIAGLGCFIIIMNWIIAYSIHVKKKHSSWVPLFGGVLLAVGIANSPFESLHGYAWLAFVIDYGCLPVLLQTAWHLIRGIGETKG